MNFDEIVKLAQDVGLNKNRAQVAAAIAMAESGGNPVQVTHDSDDDSYGLWQINMKGAMGPDRLRKYGLPSYDALLDPRRNAMVMADMSHQGGNFSAWTTYTSGKYKDFLKDKNLWDKAVQVGADTVTGAGDAVGNVADTAKSVARLADIATKATVWIANSDNWIRVVYVGGGMLILLVAASALIKETSAGKKGIQYSKKGVAYTKSKLKDGN